ncbi:MAG: alanine dehydrogenase [Flavobacteriales bacterium CG_4_10_14_0_2_um_filter_32_8]|nr:MAG: alanine dehydrogenase [Flavobacteriales bacterium CG_4_10_14_0_2_um_filter_32_8]
MKIGIIKEGKTPPDERAPLSPKQCKEVIEKFKKVSLVVQKSQVRRFKAEEFKENGIELVDSVADCDILMGVKEVPITDLIPNKTYFFFSHTIKKQAYNRNLLKAMLAKKITMVDYETLTNEFGTRLIGFGYYAGVVGSYNTFYAYGKRTGLFDLKRAYLCHDKAEMLTNLRKVQLPENYKIVITGGGRVASGVIRILEQLNINKVSPEDFITKNYNEPVYTQLFPEDYYKRIDNKPFTRKEFYENSIGYESNFMKYAQVAEMYISCHFWAKGSPLIISNEAIKSSTFNIKIIGDISCDVDGPIASTIRPSTITNPLYGYHPINESEVAFDDENAITVMAVDNLPCELPKDASAGFGRELIDKIFPHIINDKEGVIERATICKDGKLMNRFEYLRDYVNGEIMV